MIQASASQLPGQVIGVNYNGTYYYYLRNAQGDVVKLIDKTGSTVVEYTYDTWGKLLSTTGSLAATFGAEQPFRYKGYCVHHQSLDWQTRKPGSTISKADITTPNSAASSPPMSTFPLVRECWGIMRMRTA